MTPSPAKPGPDARFRFHAAAPPGEWLNDPNGLAYVGERYRLYAQHSAAGPDFKVIGWGRVSSPDLLAWRFDGVAVAPESRAWAYSGCVTDVDPLEAFLTLHDTRGKTPVQRQYRAEGDPLVVTMHELGPSGRNVRDPFVFRSAATGDWRMLVAEPCDWGAWRAGPASSIGVWASADKREWRYVARVGPWDAPGVMWEVPLLLDFGAAQLLVLSKVDRRGDGARCSVEAYAGRFDGCAFQAEGPAVPLDLGPDFYAACANTVPSWPDDRRVVVGWASNWATTRSVAWPGGTNGGPISLPRVLRLRDGRVDVAPMAAALPLAAWQGRWRSGVPLALTIGGGDSALRFGIDGGGRVRADRGGEAPHGWSLSHAVVVTEPSEITVLIDAGLVEIFFAGRSLTAFVPGAHAVMEDANGLG